MKHTTGEWKATAKEGNYIIHAAGEANCIAIVGTGTFAFTNEGEANAKLISAAPDLLRAAHNALLTLDAMNRLIATTIATETRKELEAAIKKATE